MRLAVVILVCSAMLAILTGGCGKKATYSTPKGEVTVTEKGDTTEVTFEGEEGEGKVEIKGDEAGGTITTEEGTVEFGTEAGVTEEEVGVPFYPDAKPAQAGRFLVKDEKEGFVQATFMTPDSIDKVKAFYQEKFPESRAAMDIKSADGRMVQMVLEEGDTQKTVMISQGKDEDQTAIILTRVKKSE
ncbi:MAG: hypothetical protein JSV79_11735 [Armatimonadota bacterium]|nr:MAG: hypothetical protein JSV79_11735 [Armatimonadota bacterium]